MTSRKKKQNADEKSLPKLTAAERIGRALVMESNGAADQEFYVGIVRQLATVFRKGQELDLGDFNFMLSVIRGVRPRDQLEAMLAAQMAVVHLASMTFGCRLANVESIIQQDSAERAFNKLTRTFATQMEALKRYRTGGEQKVTVQHVSVAGQSSATSQPVRKAAPSLPSPAFPDSNVVPMSISDKSKERALVAGRRKSTK